MAGYANHVLVDRDGFAEKVTEAVKRPAVSKEISIRLADKVVDAAPVNHWVTVCPPRPTRAQVVNARSFLLDRVERCRATRTAFPNLIAVDFAGIGDVVSVAADVNGVSGA